MNILKITHSAGFFSCYSKRLEGIVSFFSRYKGAPDQVDSSVQFSLYKANPIDDLVPFYFKDVPQKISYIRRVQFHNDYQFLDYQDLDIEGLKPFVEQYFSPSNHVLEIVSLFETTYKIDYTHTCAVFYRGNDKATETMLAPYESFIAQAQSIEARHPGIVFLVQTDETEFLEAFCAVFPTAIHFEEIPSIRKKVSTVHDEMPIGERAEFGARFFAATLVLAKCTYVITHTGNCALWCVLYRGSTTGVYQWLNHAWKRSSIQRFMIWFKLQTKILLRKMIKGSIGWIIVRT